jgi:hypothetical protein
MQVLTSFYRLNGSCSYDYYHLKIKKDLFNILQLHLKLILWIQLIFKTNFLFIININTSFHFVQIFIVIFTRVIIIINSVHLDLLLSVYNKYFEVPPFYILFILMYYYSSILYSGTVAFHYKNDFQRVLHALR